MKQNNFFSLFPFTDLTGMSSTRKKSHVSLLQKDRTWGNRLQQVQEVLSEYEEKFLHCVSDRALVQAAQRGCGVCSEVIQSYLGHDLVQVSLIYQRNWTR